MVSKSIFKSSNILIDKLKNSYFLVNKNTRRLYHKRIAISHGSGGLSETEFKLSDFFLQNGFEVQLFDHFSSLSVKKLHWGYKNGFIDNHSASLLDLIETVGPNECICENHLGMSLGAYIGLNNTSLFKRVFCCYPGGFPILKNQFMENRMKVHVFEGTHDLWTKFPTQLRRLIKKNQFHRIEKAYHSFMSFGKDKKCSVYSYQFKDLLVDKELLSNIKLSHSSISNYAGWKQVITRNKTNQQAIKIVLNKIKEEVGFDK